LLSALLLVSCATNQGAGPDAGAGSEAPGRVVGVSEISLEPLEYDADGQISALAFRGPDIRGSVRSGGTWEITRPISHGRIRCATYETGIQLGQGDPACSYVQWITAVDYGTRQTHCNSATRVHAGGGELSDIGARFPSLNCVRVVTRCEGPC
jgi:hypothetical protein